MGYGYESWVDYVLGDAGYRRSLSEWRTALESPRYWAMGYGLCSLGGWWVGKFEVAESTVGVEDSTQIPKKLGCGFWVRQFEVLEITVGVEGSTRILKKLGYGLWVTGYKIGVHYRLGYLRQWRLLSERKRAHKFPRNWATGYEV